MSHSKTQKAINDLKRRTAIVRVNIGLLGKEMSEEEIKGTLEVADEVDTLIRAYESQIELNKKQNIKIKNQRSLLRFLQRKQGDENAV